MTTPSHASVAGGASWMMAARLTDRVLGFGSTLILARVLTPGDFGLVAMAMAVIGLIELATAFGFEVPLLRAAQPTRAQYDTVWTLNVLFAAGCGATIALAAYPAAGFYGDARLAPVMLVLALSWAAGGLANVGTIDFRRNLDFAKEFRFMMAARVVSFAVTIPMALLLRTYWALIAGMLVSRLVNVLLSYLWHPYRPRFCLQEARALFSFSLWILVEKIASFGNGQAPDFLLGKTHGAVEVGVFRLGSEIGYLPGSELVAPINRALLPGASRLAESGRSMGDIVALTTGVIALVLVPACLGIAAVADPLVRTLLGPQWLAAIPVVEIMAINALFVAVWASQQTALLAAGLPRLPGLIAVGRLIVFVPCLFALTPPYGAWGVAVATLISSAVMLGIGIQVSLQSLGLPSRRFYGAMVRPLVAASVMFGVVRVVLGGIDGLGGVPAPIALLAGAGVGVAAYTAVMALLYVLSGRPRAAESWFLGRVATVAGPLVARLRKQA